MTDIFKEGLIRVVNEGDAGHRYETRVLTKEEVNTLFDAFMEKLKDGK